MHQSSPSSLHAYRVTWKIDNEPLTKMTDESGKVVEPSAYQYDPRVVKVDDSYYVTWCNEFPGTGSPTIGIARTKDFVTFIRHEDAFLPFNRNGVLFPRRIDGEYVMLNRPSDDGHTPFGDM